MVCRGNPCRDRAGDVVMSSLLADIGGTNVRFALVCNGALGPIHRFDVRAHAGIVPALRGFLDDHAATVSVDVAFLAVAGPVEKGSCRLTNSRWLVDAAELKREFGFSTVRLVNDLEAVALSLPHLRPSELHLVGPNRSPEEQPIAVISPGTGLGMACRLPSGRVVASEGGHATLAAGNDREEALIGVLRRQHGHVSIERALSGDGLVNLYRAIAAVDGRECPARTAPEITAAGLAGDCPIGREALDTFCALLGAAAGDVALFFGARGGIFVGGGIVPRMVGHLERTEFRRRFEAKGRFQPYVAAIPTMVVLQPDPAFLGLAALAGSAIRRCEDGRARG